MWEVLDQIENRGNAEGIILEETRGEEKAGETAQRLYTIGLGVDKIVLAVGYAADIIGRRLGLRSV